MKLLQEARIQGVATMRGDGMCDGVRWLIATPVGRLTMQTWQPSPAELRTLVSQVCAFPTLIRACTVFTKLCGGLLHLRNSMIGNPYCSQKCRSSCVNAHDLVVMLACRMQYPHRL